MSRVLVAVFDGLKPSQVTPRLMPNLHWLASQGATFTNHHCVFPSVTRINGSSMVTGRYPGAHGLAGNMVVMRDFESSRPFSALEPALREVTERLGAVLLVPTLGDILARHGRKFIAVGTGTTGNSYMHNPNASAGSGATIHPEFTLPYSLYDEIVGRFGPWPEDSVPNTQRIALSVRVLTEYVIAVRDPAASLIWFSEPDHAHHRHGVGHPTSNEALRAADAEFGKLLRWMGETGRSEHTDVLVASDHGYSTICGVVNIDSALREAGFPASTDAGGVISAVNGGAVLFYVNDSDQDVSDRLATWLMEQPWCGPLVVSRAVEGIPGGLPANLLGIEGPRAPEVVMSFRWDSRPNGSGYRGHAYSTGGAPGLGQHGSMSRHEMSTVLFAAGPHFKSGARVDVPTGNVDLAPTVLHLLGIEPKEPWPFDGRPLLEALGDGPDTGDVKWEKELHTAERPLRSETYRQEVMLSHVGHTTYIDYGKR